MNPSNIPSDVTVVAAYYVARREELFNSIGSFDLLKCVAIYNDGRAIVTKLSNMVTSIRIKDDELDLYEVETHANEKRTLPFVVI